MSAPVAVLDEIARRLGGSGNPRVVVALSGGVDSSVAALLLRELGVHVTALYMKNWNEPSDEGHCQFEDDVAAALEVCDRLGVEINTVDFSKAYWDGVFEDFVHQYARGRTPNPDVLCNREVKFKVFLEHAMAVGGDLIATGHYARIEHGEAGPRLLKGLDPGKDQSYFLYTLGAGQLTKTLFPVGELHKSDVRALARRAGLVTHNRKDSTGICFIGERPFREFLARYVPARPGDIVTEHGVVVGHHQGVAFYTLGQRRGLGIGGVRGAAEAAWFVVAKDVARNELVVAQGHTHPALMSTRLHARESSWVAGTPPADGARCCAKTRYRQADQPCSFHALDADAFELRFDAPQRAVTPGQSVVLYDGARCLGGAIIDEAFA